MDDFTLAIVLTAAGAAIGGAFVAGVAQLLKALLPESMQTGRGIIAIVYALSALLVAAAFQAAPEATPDTFGGDAFLFVFSWQGVTQAAIGANQLARKVESIRSGTNDPTGPDPR
jgi:hypothetical protein